MIPFTPCISAASSSIAATLPRADEGAPMLKLSALALDPQSVEAQSRLAAVLIVRVIIGTSDSAAADIARADRLVRQALAASPRNSIAHWVKGQVLRTQQRCAHAIPEYEAALALNRNGVIALTSLGWCKLYAGSIEDVIPLQEQAIRLSPRDPAIGFW